MGDTSSLEAALQAIPGEIGVKPKAILVISAHWEEREFTVQASPHPPMLYDYEGFPKHTYEIKYSAAGSPEVAARVQELLSGASITSRTDALRGYDHGTFVALSVMYPAADVPVLQLSLRHGLNSQAHIAAGRALAPLRDEGVLIVGSGVPSYHNRSGFFDGNSEAPSREFDAWLTRACVHTCGAERTKLLEEWEAAPSARAAHPREEHFVPLLVALGAAEGESGFRQYHCDHAFFGRVTESGYRFGAAVAA